MKLIVIAITKHAIGIPTNLPVILNKCLIIDAQFSGKNLNYLLAQFVNKLEPS